MRLKTGLFLLTLVSALGPHLAAGLRLEHVVVYGVFAVCIFLLFLGVKAQRLLLLLSFSLLLSVAAFIIADLIAKPDQRMGGYFAALDNVLMPFCLLVSSAVLLPGLDETAFRKILVFLVHLSVAIGLIIILSTQVDLSFFFRFFIQDTTSDDSVWAQSFALGRYIGIFTQPIEAGVFFSLALFVLIYLNRIMAFKGKLVGLYFFVLLVGGILSLSKNFYLLGLFHGLLLWGILSGWSLIRIGRTFLMLLMIPVLGILIFADDLGVYLTSLQALYESEGLIAAITAGRFAASGGTTVEQLFAQFYNQSPLFGFGLGTYLPLDNGYLEFAYQGGAFALLGYLIFLLFCLGFALLHYRSNKSARFLAVLSSFMIFASLGGPVVTANRVNIILVILLGMLFYAISQFPKNKFNVE